LKPSYAEAHGNLGATLQDLGRLDEAEASCTQAIVLKPDFAEAHTNLGATLQELGRLEEAEASLRQAIALKSDFAEAHYNLGITLGELGRLDAAIDSYTKALKIEPDHARAYNNMALALRGAIFEKPNPDFQEIITSILDRKTYVRPADISSAAISLLKFEPAIKTVFKMHSAGGLRLSLQEVISDLSEVPLLLKLMSVSRLADLELEAIFTDIRSGLLSSISEITGSSEVLRFQSALALQCFTNEYVYGQTDNEAKALEALEAVVKESLLKGEQPSPQSILCLATYKALHEYEWCDLHTVTADTEEVFTRQVIEPKQEIRLKSDIPILQEITDKVSSKVREQYEENPYPRWVNTGLPLNPSSISEVTKKLELSIFDPKINDVENPSILIGGCGTGQHSIGTAAKFASSTVLAVDLSLASLAYAKRKTEELSVQNVEYMHADILDLGKLDRQFDIVESLGVLHHMDDPMAGWRVLTDCLKPGGLMRVGLYSELARQHIVKIREEISQSGIGPSDDAMKIFRRDIIGSNEDHHKRVREFGDFYSTSELRDLLFHMQEHWFSLPQIQGCLSELGLRFCGFEADKIVQNFKLTNIGTDDPYDLDKWNVYEEANPNIFIGMYQFWCQKVA
jgi:SAM-dependent methyltransferase